MNSVCREWMACRFSLGIFPPILDCSDAYDIGNWSTCMFPTYPTKQLISHLPVTHDHLFQRMQTHKAWVWGGTSSWPWLGSKWADWLLKTVREMISCSKSCHHLHMISHLWGTLTSSVTSWQYQSCGSKRWTPSKVAKWCYYAFKKQWLTTHTL